MPSYLYAVQDENGREIVSAHVDVEKVSDVTASFGESTVQLLFEDVVIDEAAWLAEDGPVTLHRWPSDDKLAKPVSHPVR